jgi:NAD(P)-dependent dehydrogenase (short-subunit alcohol dehydrogenase family)
MELKNKRVVITGGTSGIGLALAHALTAAGAKVFITGRRADALSTALGGLDGAAGACADVATPEGRAQTLDAAVASLGGLDILVNNAGGVRAGRLENTPEADIEVMVTVDLLAPILLVRSAMPMLRASGDAMVVNVASGIALVGAPFYATYAAVKAGLARFGESLRRELKGEGIHVLTAYPGGTDTPMMKTNRAGPELGFSREPASAVAQAIVDGMKSDAFEVIRGGEVRAEMIALNREDPAAIDAKFLTRKSALEDAVKDHNAL